MQAPCSRFREDVLGVLEGNAEPSLLEHVAGCDDCRDARHALDQNTTELAKAGDDFTVSDALTARLAALAEVEGERISETRMRGAEPASAPRTSSKPRVSKKAIWLLLAAAASVGASVFVGVKIADRQQKSPEAAATRAWCWRPAQGSKVQCVCMRGKATSACQIGANTSAYRRAFAWARASRTKKRAGGRVRSLQGGRIITLTTK